MNNNCIPTSNDVPHLESLIHRHFPEPQRLMLSDSLFHISDKGIDSFVVLSRNDLARQYPNGIPNAKKLLFHEGFASYMVYLYKSKETEDGVLENLFSVVCNSLSRGDVLWGRPKQYEEKNAFMELNFYSITRLTRVFQIH